MRVRDLEPGPVLDDLIAKYVFGCNEGARGMMSYGGPRYSTDIRGAWLVVEKMRIDKECTVGEITSHILRSDDPPFTPVGVEWGVLFKGGKSAYADASTAPHAICLAALLATVGEEVDRD